MTSAAATADAVAHRVDPRELVPVAPELFVPDVREAVRFYADILGFEAYRVEPDFAVVALGAAHVLLADERMYGAMGGAAAEGPRGAYVDIRVMISHVDAMHKRCVDAGLEIVHDVADRDYGLRDFIVRDLNGFRLRFAAPLR